MGSPPCPIHFSRLFLLAHAGFKVGVLFQWGLAALRYAERIAGFVKKDQPLDDCLLSHEA
jgi:hypothetical protein